MVSTRGMRTLSIAPVIVPPRSPGVFQSEMIFLNAAANELLGTIPICIGTPGGTSRALPQTVGHALHLGSLVHTTHVRVSRLGALALGAARLTKYAGRRKP
jgi:hypothetical protein